LVTGYYGSLTKTAVANFQSRNNIASVGRVGPSTLPVINSQIANGIGAGGDKAAPLITAISVSTTNNSAMVSWNTNENARGKVFYGTTPITLRNTTDTTGIDGVEATISGTMAPFDGIARTTQVASITGLASSTTYYYVIESFDSVTNVSHTLPASFRTN
jgi:peptidoglycan hydrolase-like protein with peptidoglycan-binding domain